MRPSFAVVAGGILRAIEEGKNHPLSQSKTAQGLVIPDGLTPKWQEFHPRLNVALKYQLLLCELLQFQALHPEYERDGGYSPVHVGKVFSQCVIKTKDGMDRALERLRTMKLIKTRGKGDKLEVWIDLDRVVRNYSVYPEDLEGE